MKLFVTLEINDDEALQYLDTASPDKRPIGLAVEKIIEDTITRMVGDIPTRLTVTNMKREK